MKNKTISNLLLVSIGLAVVTAIFETSLSVVVEDNYTIAGLGMGIFGIWGAIKLRSIE